MKNKISRIALAAGFVISIASMALALDPVTLEEIGVPTTFAAKTSVTTTMRAVGIPLAYKVKAEGGTADFTIGVSSQNTGAYTVQTSSTIYVLQGSSQAVESTFRAISYNPVLIITRIDAATTVYVTIDYLKQRHDGVRF